MDLRVDAASLLAPRPQAASGASRHDSGPADFARSLEQARSADAREDSPRERAIDRRSLPREDDAAPRERRPAPTPTAKLHPPTVSGGRERNRPEPAPDPAPADNEPPEAPPVRGRGPGSKTERPIESTDEPSPRQTEPPRAAEPDRADSANRTAESEAACASAIDRAAAGAEDTGTSQAQSNAAAGTPAASSNLATGTSPAGTTVASAGTAAATLVSDMAARQGASAAASTAASTAASGAAADAASSVESGLQASRGPDAGTTGAQVGAASFASALGAAGSPPATAGAAAQAAGPAANAAQNPQAPAIAGSPAATRPMARVDAGGADVAPVTAASGAAGAASTTLPFEPAIDGAAMPGAAAGTPSAQATTSSPMPASAEPPVLQGRLAAHPASPQFVPQLGAQLEMFIREGVQHARLQLHPAELGPVAVQIQLEGGQAQVALAADHAATRERLLEALPQLQRQLEQNGLAWAGGSVGSQLADNPRERSGDAQQRDASNGNTSRARDSGSANGNAGSIAAPTPQRSRGLVDLVA